MNKVLHKITIFLLFLLRSTIVLSQQDSLVSNLQSFVQNIAAFNRLLPQEQVYLHFDNTGYFMGETIWFKAYVVRSDSLHATDLSSVLYVELLTPGGEIVDTRKINITNGQAHGEFVLDKVLNSGFYEVRAYTRYMTNWNENIFSRTIPIFRQPTYEGDYSKMIINERSHAKRLPDNREKTTEKSHNLNLYFYPEGGNSIVGIPCKIAFQATNKQGAEVEIAGEVYNSKDSLLTTFSTMHEGRGVFSYVPDGKKNKAKVRYGKKEYTFSLPEALSSGYTISVDNQRNEQVRVMVNKSADLLPEPLGLTLIKGGRLHLFHTLHLENESHAFSIPKNKLPSGVNRLTLFTSRGEVLAERMFFIYPHDSVCLEIQTDKKEYFPYDSIRLDVNLHSQNNLPLESTFSLSVRDGGTTTNGNSIDICNNLLLSSELQGYIGNPKYYLEADDRPHRMTSDLLMMVQGWRRYDWQVMAGLESFSVQQPMEEGLLIDGQVLLNWQRKGRSSAKLNVSLYSKDGSSMLGSCVVDSTGKFVFTVPDCSGEWNLHLKSLVNNKPKKHRITLNRNFSPATSRSYTYMDTHLMPPDEKISSWTDTLSLENLSSLKQEQVINLDEVIIQENRPSRKRWQDESEGMSVGSIYYNVEREMLQYEDSGKGTPLIYEWIKEKNKYFDYIQHPFLRITSELTGEDYWYTDIKGIGNSLMMPHKLTVKEEIYALNNRSMPGNMISDWAKKAYFEALERNHIQEMYTASYKNKPVVFILNNEYMDQEVMGPGMSAILGEDVKSVIISEEEGVWRKYRSDLNPEPQYVTVFIYTFPNRARALKGVRRTHFYGYSYPKEFYSPNYGILPIEPDHRRTLYWNPNVQTDSTGHAVIRFYNNASCKQIKISAEGVTEKGIPFKLKK